LRTGEEHACSAERQLAEMWKGGVQIDRQYGNHYILFSSLVTVSVVVRLHFHHTTLGPRFQFSIVCLSEEMAEGLFDINHHRQVDIGHTIPEKRNNRHLEKQQPREQAISEKRSQSLLTCILLQLHKL
jgi:hypothetical protein